MTQSNNKRYDLIIVGAGPAGLEAALQAKKKGLSYLLLDKDDAGSLIKNTMGNKRFLHVYGRNKAFLSGALPFPDYCYGEELVAGWRQISSDINLRKGVTVQSAKKEGDVFVVDVSGEVLECKNLLVSSGTFDLHRELNVPGEKNNSKVQYSLDYYNDYAGKNIIVVGGGNSAAETAIYCAPSNNVTIPVRKDVLADAVTEINKNDVLKFSGEGKINLLFNSEVKKITEDKVMAQVGNETKEFSYDLLFVHIGFVSPADFLFKMGVPIDNLKPVFDKTTFETSISGLYVAGSITGADSIIESANQGYEVIKNLK
jgi:thioredoxin reductase (NADPH)